VYRVEKACEVGNIFPLETRFPDAFGFRYQSDTNESKPVYMGSYGIGPSRVMGVIVESCFDEKGIIWPKNVAPFEYIIIGIWDKGMEKAREVYTKMQSLWYDVCFDDRDLGPGFKFKDADLIGYPYQIVIGNKTLEQWDFCELSERKNGEKKMLEIETLYTL
jgi:prolyl-tRNA synthetase